MNFFESQAKARRATGWLLFYYLLAVAGIVLSVYGLVFHFALGDKHDPAVFLGVLLGVLAVIGLGSLYKTFELRAGGSAVAEMLGGELVPPNTGDFKLRRLLNVVEEMALASGTPVPAVYLLREEEAINAFAAGHTPSDAVIGVTQGCVEKLSRDELQGVIAHEFSHILNGDMLLNLRLTGILFGILLLAIIGRTALRVFSHTRTTRSSDSKNSGGALAAVMLAGLALMLIGYIGVFFAKLIKAAVSRQREYLADASAVQFTRNPSGIANALKRIGGFSDGSRIGNYHADEVAHLFFANGLRASWVNLFSTHPPLVQRIKAIQPDWDGSFELPAPTWEEKPARPDASGLAAFSDNPIRKAGTFSEPELAYASSALAQLPRDLQERMRDPAAAPGLIYALLLGDRAGEDSSQDGLLAGPGISHQELAGLRAKLTDLGPQLRLPLVDLALPALRQMSAAQYGQFMQRVKALIAADGKLSLFELALIKVLERHLGRHFGPAYRRVDFYSTQALCKEIGLLLSAVAVAGAQSSGEAANAFSAAAAKIPGRVSFTADAGVASVDAALGKLENSSLPIKRAVLEACAVAISFDRQVHLQEAELFRAIADAFGCPMPPLSV